MAPGNDVQESSKFCLKWDGFHSNLTSVFENLRQGEELVDITLCCDGRKLKAHKMMLSAASPFFRDLLQENPCQHPVFFLRDTRCQDMAAIIEFVYRGSVNVSQAQLASFIQTAELLQIRGLSGDDDKKESPPLSAEPVAAERPSAAPTFRGPRAPDSPPAPPQRYRAAPAAGGAGRPRAPTPPAKRRRVSTTPPPQPLPPPLPSAMAAPVEPPAPRPPPPPPQLPPLPPPELQETLVKQEKVEESDDDVTSVYDSGMPASLEQMIFMPQQYPRGMMASTPNLVSTPSAAANSSEDHSQAASHVCGKCGASYRTSTSLAHHARLHDGLTLCPICGVAQSRICNLRRHLMQRHRLSRQQAVQLIPPRVDRLARAAADLAAGGAHMVSPEAAAAAAEMVLQGAVAGVEPGQYVVR